LPYSVTGEPYTGIATPKPRRTEVSHYNMDINNKARIHWACRRGMRELDISIMPFFEYEYDSLSDKDKALFIRLLECDDPDLFNWLMNHGAPQDDELQRMVTLIQTRNKDRGPVAM
jgi:antitoxin CptB